MTKYKILNDYLEQDRAKDAIVGKVTYLSVADVESILDEVVASDGDLADVRLSSLIDEWFKRQVKYEQTASNAEKWQHEIRFNAKAQATRDCWKELQRLIEDEA